jgi:hypothetical protein
MTDITPAEQIAWQRRAVILLGKLLELAVKKNLPPVTWTVGRAGCSLAGQVTGQEASDCRDTFTAWQAAITSASGQEPDHGREHDFGGQTRLVADWDRIPVTLAPGTGVPPRVHVALAASIWRDDREEDPDA